MLFSRVKCPTAGIALRHRCLGLNFFKPNVGANEQCAKKHRGLITTTFQKLVRIIGHGETLLTKELGFQAKELLKKADIWMGELPRFTGTTKELKGSGKCFLVLFHQISQGQRDRSADSFLTVDKHLSSSL